MYDCDDRSEISSATRQTSTERFKVILSEQLQANERLELDNEKKTIQIRKMLALLKSRRLLTQTKTCRLPSWLMPPRGNSMVAIARRELLLMPKRESER